MPARNDFVAWSPQEIARLRHLSEVLGLGSRQAARRLNDDIHGGEAVRTETMVNLARSRNGILVNKRGTPSQDDTVTQTVNVEDKGDTLEVRTMGSEVKTIDELVARAKIDLTKYEVDRPETSMYETSVRDETGKIRKVQNFRIVARFRLKHGPNVKEQVEALIAGAFAVREHRTTTAKLKNTATLRPAVRGSGTANDALMQAVVIADPHLAKYAWSEETGGADYDLDIASRLVDNAARDLMDWGDERKPAVRYLLGLGDLLHYDNPQGHTTSGTPQDRDTRMAKMLKRASEVLVGLVLRSAETCSTKIVLVPGNHDRATTYAMQLILAHRFHNDPRVTVDLDPKARKYIEWGACLLGLTHGDTARKRLQQLMQVEKKEAWGRSKVREWHHGHLHSEASTVTEGGVTIRQHLSLSPPDSWHSLEGYVGAPRGMDSYLYHQDGYLRGTWRSAVLDG